MRRLTPLLLALVVGCAPVASSPTPTVAPATSSAPTPTVTVAPTNAPTSSPTPTPIPLPTFASIAAAGNGVLWAAVASVRLFVSSDRGVTWAERSVPQPGGVQEISFVSADEGWALGPASPATQCQTQGVSLWHTADGARTWQKITPTGIGDAQCKDTMAFNDGQRGYLIAHDPNTPALVYRTSDGGKTWTASARLPDPPGFTAAPAGFQLRPGPVADFGSVLYLYAAGNNGGRMAGYVFKSTNGGATWAFAGTPPTNDFGISFLTPTRWIAWLLPQPSAETTDGGSTWHPFASDYQQAAPVAPQVVFGDAMTGYATVRGGIQRTTDGGAHWTAIKTPGTLSP